jgi:two-component system response regulator PilR (NtrC family)
METNKKILIVDDNHLFLSSLSGFIHKVCGFQGRVIEVANGSEAIQEAASSFYSLCFLDLYLPDINGLEVMKTIHFISPETRVAIMTASYIPDYMRKSIEEDASLFIEKSFDLNVIKSFVREGLASVG